MTTRSATLLLALSLWAGTACAADLVNINTADSAALQTLNGIGPSKAQAIIDYRTQHGAFTSIDQIMNVSGIGMATYNNIKNFITVSPSQTQSQTAQDQSTSSSQSTQSTSQTTTSGGSIPLPTLNVRVTSGAAFAGAGTLFEGAVYDDSGAPILANVRYIWTFGDGASAEGKRVWHTYLYPGTYVAQLSASYNLEGGVARQTVVVAQPAVHLVSEGDGSLSIYNDSSNDLDIGWWQLVDGTLAPFAVPEGTVVLAQGGTRFASSVTGLPGSRSAVLLYPNGSQAAQASVGNNSPLRGQQIAASNSPAQKSSDLLSEPPVSRGGSAGQTFAPGNSTLQQTRKGDVLGAETSALSHGEEPLWPYALGVFALVVLGIGTMYYARTPMPTPETPDLSEGFDIE
ncbi:MAG: helix-hairpin-helix domain-containing protein [Patescibacteria group bacterium]|nr:helix-hairpin-helix domain-containing protein [Patescibacteria group bacterium]